MASSSWTTRATPCAWPRPPAASSRSTPPSPSWSSRSAPATAWSAAPSRATTPRPRRACPAWAGGSRPTWRRWRRARPTWWCSTRGRPPPPPRRGSERSAFRCSPSAPTGWPTSPGSPACSARCSARAGPPTRWPTSYDAALDRLRRARRVPAPAPTIALVTWDQPLIVLGAGSFVSEMVELAGARNVFDDVSAAIRPGLARGARVPRAALRGHRRLDVRRARPAPRVAGGGGGPRRTGCSRSPNAASPTLPARARRRSPPCGASSIRRLARPLSKETRQ